MAESITRNGIEPVGRHEPHYGDEKVVYDEVTLGDYDADDDGNGNSYDLMTSYGFSRLLLVEVQVLGGAAYEARYDYTNESIVVLALSDGTEPAQGTTLDIDLRLRIVGTGA